MLELPSERDKHTLISYNAVGTQAQHYPVPFASSTVFSDLEA